MARRKRRSADFDLEAEAATAARKERRKARRRVIGNELQRLVLLLLGITITSLGFALFQVPNNLAAGGVSGIGIIVNAFTGFSPSLFYLLANIPLMILGYWALGGWHFLYRTVLSVVGFTLITEWAARTLPGVLESWPITDNVLLAAIYAGLVGGIGGGLIYLAGGTMGGTAIVGRIIQVRTGIPLSQVYLMVDGVIVITAGLVFGWEKALYAWLTLLLSGIATDYVLEGPSRTRTATIITTRPQEMIEALMNDLGRGVSYWEAMGGYTHEPRTMIFCTFYRPQLVELKRIVSRIDGDAFFTIGVVQQAVGQGFSDIHKTGE
jgi:uncharacterized membrane-anchored protein YitT (DUF2179 family)